MYARVATFEHEPDDFPQAIDDVRRRVQSEPPPGLENARMLMLVDRSTGRGLGITLYDDEDAMRRGDGALNAMPRPGGSRTSVVFYDVPVHNLT
jgi:hypothetical protein